MAGYMENFLAKIEAKKTRQENLLRDMKRLQKTVAKHFKIPIADLTSKKRPSELVYPRQIAFFIAKEHFHYYFQEIAECFHRHRATVIYAYYKLKKQMNEDPPLKNTITQLIAIIQPIVDQPKPSEEPQNKT